MRKANNAHSELSMVTEVMVPGTFVNQVAHRLFGRGYRLIEPSLIAFVVQAVVEDVFTSKRVLRDLDQVLHLAIERHEEALEEHFKMHPPEDETLH